MLVRVVNLVFVIFLGVAAYGMDEPEDCVTKEISQAPGDPRWNERFTNASIRELAKEVFSSKEKPAWLDEFMKEHRLRPLMAIAEPVNRTLSHIDKKSVFDPLYKMVRNWGLMEGLKFFEKEYMEKAVVQFTESLKQENRPQADLVLFSELWTPQYPTRERRVYIDEIKFVLMTFTGEKIACLRLQHHTRL